MLFQTPKAIPPVLWIALVSGGTALVWLFVTVCRSFLGRPERQFQQAVASRILVSSYAWMLLVLALAVLGFSAAGRYGFEQEKLTKIDPQLAAWSVFEHRVAVQSRLELLQILNTPRE